LSSVRKKNREREREGEIVRNVEEHCGETKRGIDIDEKNEGELPPILLIRLRWLIQKRAAKSRRVERG
jgi:hypothetical protein